MPTRFAGAHCIISDSTPINRRKLQTPPSTSSKQDRLCLLPFRHLWALALRLLHPHRQLRLLPHLLRLRGLLPHRGPHPYQGLVLRRHHAQRLRISWYSAPIVGRLCQTPSWVTPIGVSQKRPTVPVPVYRMPESHSHWTFVIWPATTSTSNGPYRPILLV